MEREEHFNMWVRKHVCVEKILLGPEESAVIDPSLWVFVWEEDIVDMDEYARLERG